MLNREQIKEIIPYDEPFLFVHGVEEMTENSIRGFYQTSPDDYYFKGHFIDFPIMPGVLIVESLAQLSTILLREKNKDNHKKYHFLAYDVRSVQFYKPIFPGKKISLKAEVLGVYEIKSASAVRQPAEADAPMSRVAHIKSQALVENDLKCEARFSVAIIDKKEFDKIYKKI